MTEEDGITIKTESIIIGEKITGQTEAILSRQRDRDKKIDNKIL